MIVKYCFTFKTLFHGLRIADLVHVGETVTEALIFDFHTKTYVYGNCFDIFKSDTMYQSVAKIVH